MTTDATPGSATPPGARRNVESIEPGTGVAWRRFEHATAEEIDDAVGAARQAQLAWASGGLRRRLTMLERFHDVLLERRREAAEVVSRESGKPVSEALTSEIVVTLDLARYYRREAPGFLDAGWFTPSSAAMWRKRVRLEQEPHGVVGIISPWNYPLMLPAGLILPALVTGNAVILKPSELTPSTGELLGEMLREAGVPPGVFTVLQGDGQVGRELTRARVDKIFFTGSVATGRRVAVACAERLVPCALELGGSDAAIVLSDADVEHAASGLLWARYSNCGQTCVAPKRVFVEASIHDALVAALTRRVQALHVSAARDGGAELGPPIRPFQHELLTAQLDDAVARGARVAARAPIPVNDARFLAPALLTDVPPDARVMTEETFGPLLPIVRVRDEDEAVARANGGDFGLSSSVWSRDRSRALRVARRIEAGTVMINDAVSVAGMADVPHGGVKASGFGRSHGRHGLEECVRVKAIVDDRFTYWRQPWWFGYSPNGVQDVDGYARATHGRTLRERLSGLLPMLRLVFRPQRRL
jgi:acyl-CoA reductase-like NAD-dependent aldehyde dehydrogenase